MGRYRHVSNACSPDHEAAVTLAHGQNPNSVRVIRRDNVQTHLRGWEAFNTSDWMGNENASSLSIY
jgi:hypothetical protein